MIVERTPYQDKVINLAHDIIGAFNTGEVSGSIYGFDARINTGVDSDGDIIWKEDADHAVSDRDHNVCDNDECFETKKAELQKEYPGIEISGYEYNNYDYNDTFIEHCSVCGIALDESLSSISEEFPYLFEEMKTKDEMLNNALEIEAVLSGMPRTKEEKYYDEADAEKNYRKRIHWIKQKFRSYATFAHRVISALFPIENADLKKLEYIGGLWTVTGELISDEIYKAKYLFMEKNSMSWKECFLYGDFHAGTFDEALGMKAKRIAKKEKFIKTNKNALRFFKFEDSLAAGNCEAGTLNFIRLAGLNKDYGYRGDFLLEKAFAFRVEEYVERMINGQ